MKLLPNCFTLVATTVAAVTAQIVDVRTFVPSSTASPSITPSPSQSPTETPTMSPTETPTMSPTETPPCKGDWQCYCAIGTVSGNPCLPGLDEVLGRGFNVVTARRLLPIIPLEFGSGRLFQHSLLGVFEIPDNVDVTEVREQTEEWIQSWYRGTLEFRRELSARVGLTGVRFKRGFFSASAEFQKLRQQSFAAEKFMSENIFIRRLYNARIRTVGAPVTDEAMQLVDQFTGGKDPGFIVGEVGTHLIEEATFGGYLRLSTSVSSCVLSSLEQVEVENQIAKGFFGAVTSFEETVNCTILRDYASYSRDVVGGDVRLLDTLGVYETAEEAVTEGWSDSIQTSPGPAETTVQELGDLLPVFASPIESYLADFENQSEVDVTTSDETCGGFLFDGCERMGSDPGIAHTLSVWITPFFIIIPVGLLI